MDCKEYLELVLKNATEYMEENMDKTSPIDKEILQHLQSAWSLAILKEPERLKHYAKKRY